ncbi:MAG: helix-hairpin-helix domain-containing protein [Betaproteobacteria bacterium]|nr:helix-hairpin-helix domain-containing protein [Betaproteobacteria bacterium]
MKRQTLFVTLIASLLFCLVTPLFAADYVHDSADEGTPPRKSKAASKKPNPKIEAKMKEAAKIKLTDINGASAEELKKLPGITDTEAKKIIAGRPYASKAHLVTRNIIANEVYEGLKKLVIAKQPNKDAKDNAALYAPKSAPKK